MNPDSGRLYTPEEIKHLSPEEVEKLILLDEHEYKKLRRIGPSKRSANLSKMRGHLPPER